jgi:oxygen-independent coproporphyrinogen-3 oxidase
VLRALDLDPAQSPLQGLAEDGFVTLKDGRLAATEKGRPVLDAVLKTLLV